MRNGSPCVTLKAGNRLRDIAPGQSLVKVQLDQKGAALDVEVDWGLMSLMRSKMENLVQMCRRFLMCCCCCCSFARNRWMVWVEFFEVV